MNTNDTLALPDLAGIATADLVETIGGGKFKAAYINWSRTLQLLRTHAPGWMPELVPTPDGASIVHAAPVGAFLLIRFRHLDGRVTPAVPQAIMDTYNAAIPLAKITARDVTDTHRRGVCMAAAFTFGLAYELWAKLPLESGYQEEPQPVTLPDSPERDALLADLLSVCDEGTEAFRKAWKALAADQRALVADAMPAFRNRCAKADAEAQE